MAASDKNIIITPNRSGPTAQPEIFFGGSGNNPIRLKVLDDSAGTISFEGSAGQLFSINNSLTSGSIFSVNDVSGIPSINVDANGIISMAAFGGTVGIGTTTPTSKLSVAGTISATNIVNGIVVGGSTLTGSVSLTAGSNITLTPSGSTITVASTASGGGGVTTTAANTWTATQTFSGGISGSGATFSGDVRAARVVGGNGAAIGGGGLVVNGTLGDNDSQLILKKPSQSAFSVLSWNGESYINTNTYYENGVWVHSAPSGNVNSSLFNIIPGTGVKWYAANNSTSGTWNVANGVLLWNDSGVWSGGYTGNVVTRVIVGGSSITGNVSLTAGSNITLTPSGSTITIASSAGGGGGVTTTAANTWTATQTFSGGINVSAGATFTSSVQSNTGYRVGAGAINAQTTGYSLVAGDNGKIVTINSASAVTLTAGTAVGTTGFSCTIIQLGAGQVTVAASGTTINSIAGLKFQGQHAAASLICYATNTFNLAGGLTG